ncbi:MAG: dynamin family protein [Gammaproteobacteria bacterium]|nr:dynamin family protein [Gammaproteobacteria bacterium]MBU1733017.1 dynamin family protein [Gammaproteobacteria bacterium]MBU1892065.1 dynamin family protein [Gammaproteobacteria bacterium]
MSAQLEQQVEHYRQWRDDIVAAVNAYQSWLDSTGKVDAQLSLRLFDLVESLKKDRLVLAFVAEFSRGKTELINSLFFSDFKRRLLPSDVGRTTMCPTEIFHDPEEAPCIRLLPIETRFRDESIATLKRLPIEWCKIRLNLDSPEEMQEAMRNVAQKKAVPMSEARAMGLWDDTDPDLKDMVNQDGTVEIPAWRHALINYPHPLLTSGLVILDTPGLNALGTEPELTLSMIPNAHAVLFLLAMDTGVTKSDIDIWHKYIQKFVPHRLAVLNKVDILWDDLKPWDQIQLAIQHQVYETARLLELPLSNVLAISAQKALLARVRGDEMLLKKSGIQTVEAMLANHIIPAKQEILRASVLNEIGAMVATSSKSVLGQLASVRHELKELTTLTGKNRSVIKKLLDKLQADKMLYEQTVKSFNITRSVISQQGRALMTSLDSDRLDAMLAKSRTAIEDSWTTSGLLRSMQSLFGQATQQFERIHHHADQIKGLVDAAYKRFHEQHGFELLFPPPLTLEQAKRGLQNLAQQTTEFCDDPLNVMTEKHFLIRKFYNGLVASAQLLFEQARIESEVWLRASLSPLTRQIQDHKGQIEQRVATVKQIHDNTDTLDERIHELIREQERLLAQKVVIERISTIIRMPPPVHPFKAT